MVETTPRFHALRAAIGAPGARYEADEEIALVTFNYDELLDWSLMGQIGDWSLTGFEAFVERPDWRLYKLHGSSAWSRILKSRLGPFPGTESATDVIAAGADLNFEAGQFVPRPWATAFDPIKSVVAAPAIAVPTNRKQTFACPQEHVSSFAEDVTKADRVLTIGWRGSEPHALELLRGLPENCRLIVSDLTEAAARKTIENMGEVASRLRLADPLDGGFTEIVQGKWLGQWLASA